jgi:hypothetical protein
MLEFGSYEEDSRFKIQDSRIRDSRFKIQDSRSGIWDLGSEI